MVYSSSFVVPLGLRKGKQAHPTIYTNHVINQNLDEWKIELYKMDEQRLF